MDMTGIPHFVAEHELEIYPHIEPRVQKKRSIASDRRKVVKKEVDEWLKAGIVKRVRYPTWVANPVLVKKVDGSWRMCIDFKDLNKACPKDLNLEAYVDDMVIQRKTEMDMIKDIEETLLTLKKVNMKLNPKNAPSGWRRAMKKLIAELPMLTDPMKDEELMVYLSTANEAGAEINYATMKKLTLVLVHAARRLRRYFQGHTIKVVTNKTINQILNNREASGRLAKWAIKLGAYDITYTPRNAVKGQVLASFLADTVTGDDPMDEGIAGPDEPLEGGSALEALETPGKEKENKATLNFDNSNNDAEYEALLAGLRIAAEMKVEKVHDGPRKVIHKAMNAGYYWSSMQKDTNHEIRSCDSCQGDGHCWTPSKGPGKVEVPNSSSRLFHQMMSQSRFGLSAVVITDNEIQLINEPFKSWAENLRIKLISTLVYHPQANGAVERANRIIMQGIKTRLQQEGAGWVEELPNVLWVHMTMPKTSNGETLFSLVYGTEAVIPAEVGMPTRRITQGLDESNEEELNLNLVGPVLDRSSRLLRL
ncbi:reverse transcriptase domain-containing protein [Tanacetum coccineum]